MKRTFLLPIVGLLAFTFCSARAAITLPNLFQDHMVLQRDVPVPFWGTAAPGEAVTVTAGTASASVTADHDGKWSVKLGKLSASDKPMDVTVSGSNTITLHDVVVGDVWVCSGQSNMQFGLAGSSTGAAEIPQSDNPNLRFILIKSLASFKPQADCAGKWQVSSPKTTGGFSAVAYYFGKEIAATEKVPVGLIGSYVGGTPAQAWTSMDTLQSDPEFKKLWGDPAAKMIADPVALKAAHDQWLANGGAAYQAAMTKWNYDASVARQKGQPAPVKPAPYPVPEPPYEGQLGLPTVLFNGMISPLLPFAIKGVIWYQGESNAGYAHYDRLFSGLITDWRKNWGEGDFPFLYVQLPDFGARSPQPAATAGWPVTREGQFFALKLPNTGMAVTIDAGDAKNLHPPYKDIVGHRLALAARHFAYGEDLVYSSPLYDSFKIDGNKVVLTFKQVGTGLKIGTPPVTPPGSPPPPTDHLVGFAIAGSDNKFVWAQAAVTGPDTVTVTSPDVATPSAVRYGWDNDPEVNLYNSADLPASPFRTDVPAQ